MRSCLNNLGTLASVDENVTEHYAIERDSRFSHTIFLLKEIIESGKMVDPCQIMIQFSYCLRDHALTREVLDPDLINVRSIFCYGSFHDGETAMKKAHELTKEFYKDIYAPH